MAGKTWFLTGTSKGFGREWAIAALDRGDRVAATARDTATLKDLVDTYGDAILPLQLDVTDRAAAFARVQEAHDHFGRLDVVVNNAGYGHFGMIEELTEQEVRTQVETNLFGALWVTQAVLPYLPMKTVWYPGIEAEGSFMECDAAYERGLDVPYDVAEGRARRHFAGRPWLLLLTIEMPDPPGRGFRLLYTNRRPIFEKTDERFWLYAPDNAPHADAH